MVPASEHGTPGVRIRESLDARSPSFQEQRGGQEVRPNLGNAVAVHIPDREERAPIVA